MPSELRFGFESTSSPVLDFDLLTPPVRISVPSGLQLGLIELWNGLSESFMFERSTSAVACLLYGHYMNKIQLSILLSFYVGGAVEPSAVGLETCRI